MSSKPVPRTLASFAGLSQNPSLPWDSVLLVIDGQREYTTGKVPLAGIDAAVEEGARLLAFARSWRMPVIHAIHHGRPGGAEAAAHVRRRRRRADRGGDGRHHRRVGPGDTG